MEQYELNVKRTWKGRGAILCETDDGLFIFKEYAGPVKKLEFVNEYLHKIRECGDSCVEQLLPNKDGELLTYDVYKTPYLLKTYFSGTEINYKDLSECENAVKRLAGLHRLSDICYDEETDRVSVLPGYEIVSELERHNKELKKVRRYLREKGNKSTFELYLTQHFDYFYDSALQVVEELKYYESVNGNKDDLTICHGDYQYHNILSNEGPLCLINFEKCIRDYGVRDLCLFMRKLLEKSNWSTALGEKLFAAYDEVKPLTLSDQIQMHYRLAYPEKFWKIVNFYFNSGKAWIPGKNMEKLETLQEQEKQKQIFLEETMRI